jgi:prephenate dehydratase
VFHSYDDVPLRNQRNAVCKRRTRVLDNVKQLVGRQPQVVQCHADVSSTHSNQIHTFACNDTASSIDFVAQCSAIEQAAIERRVSASRK